MKSNIAKRGICIIAVSVLAACAQFGKQAPLEEPTVYSLSDGKSASLIQDGWWLQLKDNKWRFFMHKSSNLYVIPNSYSTKSVFRKDRFVVTDNLIYCLY